MKKLVILNHACAGLRPARARFLKLFLYGRLYACVCPTPRLLITSGVMWLDIDFI